MAKYDNDVDSSHKHAGSTKADRAFKRDEFQSKLPLFARLECSTKKSLLQVNQSLDLCSAAEGAGFTCVACVVCIVQLQQEAAKLGLGSEEEEVLDIFLCRGQREDKQCRSTLVMMAGDDERPGKKYICCEKGCDREGNITIICTCQ